MKVRTERRIRMMVNVSYLRPAGVCASRKRKRESRASLLLLEVVAVDDFVDTSGVCSDGRGGGGDDATSS